MNSMVNWRPDMQSLRLFIAVCEEASIARAAERESIVSSAISKRITEIEDATGVPLLIRGARGVRPTPAGTAFLHHARQILRGAERLQSELSEYAEGARGHVRVFANISSLIEFLPRDLSSFLVKHSKIRIDLQERGSLQVIEAVRDGTAEIGICIPPSNLSDLQVCPYAFDRLAVVTHRSHPLVQMEQVTFDETLPFGFVALNPESITTRQLSAYAKQRGRAINHRVYVNSFHAAAHLIAEDLAIGILAVDAIQAELSSLPIRALPLAEPWAHREIVMCVRDRDILAGPARLLLDHLEQRAVSRHGGR